MQLCGFNKHRILNHIYFSLEHESSCPIVCMQPNNQNLFIMVEEEESTESHDTLDLTLSNSFAKELKSKGVSSIFHLFYNIALIRAATIN